VPPTPLQIKLCDHSDVRMNRRLLMGACRLCGEKLGGKELLLKVMERAEKRERENLRLKNVIVEMVSREMER
jgi:hypothetical protein